MVRVDHSPKFFLANVSFVTACFLNPGTLCLPRVNASFYIPGSHAAHKAIPIVILTDEILEIKKKNEKSINSFVGAWDHQTMSPLYQR
jgi:hypothetical protein